MSGLRDVNPYFSDDEDFDEDEQKSVIDLYAAQVNGHPWWAQPQPDIIMDYEIVLIPTSYDKHYKTFEYVNDRGRLDSYRLDAWAIGTVGNPLILHGKYDAEQVWLPFVQAILANPPPTKEQRLRLALDERRKQFEYGWRLDREGQNLKKRAAEPYRVMEEHARMYPYEFGLHGLEEAEKRQFHLPFIEFQEITERREFQAFRDNWDHDDAGELLTLDISGVATLIREWLAQNTSGRYFHVNGTYTFERYEAWLHAKLKFQSGAPYQGDDV
jgi:hypothetical protein